MEDMFNDSKQILLVAKHAVSRSVDFCCEKYVEYASWAVLHLPTYWVGCRSGISANTINYYCLEEKDKITFSFWQNSVSQPQECGSVRHRLPMWAGSKGWMGSLSWHLCLCILLYLKLLLPLLILSSCAKPLLGCLEWEWRAASPSHHAAHRDSFSCAAFSFSIRGVWGEGTQMSCSGETAWTWSRAGVTAMRPAGLLSCAYPCKFAVSSTCLV